MKRIAAFIAAAIILAIKIYFVYQQKETHDLNIWMAEYHQNNGDYKQAAEFYHKATTGFWGVKKARKKHQSAELLVSGLEDMYSAKYSAAFTKFQSAAGYGSIPAYYYLGELTLEGMGTPCDMQLAWEYFQEASHGGFKLADWKIGNFYELGIHVQQDTEKAEQIYRDIIPYIKRMAEAGDPEALIVLGRMYYYGLGTAESSRHALEHFTAAAAKGYALAYTELGQLHYLQNDGRNNAIHEAKAWLQNSANLGEPRGQVLLADIHLAVNSIEENIQAIKLLNQAAAQNYPKALLRLSKFHYQGLHVPQDNKKAFEYSHRAVTHDKDHLIANRNMGFFYKEGIGVPRNYRLAKDYFLRVTELDPVSTDELVEVALLYRQGGYELEKSEAKFYEYCAIAEQKGNPAAKRLLAGYNTSSGNLSPLIR